MRDADYAKMILTIVPPAMRVIREEMRSSAKSELTVPQFRVLARLSRSPATNRELSDWMGVAPPTMTRMLSPLVKRGLILRVGQSEDRRQVVLSPSAVGTKLYEKIYKVVHLRFTGKVEKLSKEKKSELMAGLHILSEILK